MPQAIMPCWHKKWPARWPGYTRLGEANQPEWQINCVGHKAGNDEANEQLVKSTV